MNRRRFIAAGAAILAYPSLSRSAPASSIHDAYTLWYNRPSAIGLAEGFGCGFITSSGSIEVAQLDSTLRELGRYPIYGFNAASDHGSPALLRIPTGRRKGHVIACFSNHASEMFVSRTSTPDDLSKWGPVRSLDQGRCTYVSLGALPGGSIALMYTAQHSFGAYEPGQWRETLYMISQDGGESWSHPKSFIGFGPGTFPYSTPIGVSHDGRVATSYALYTYEHQRHMGLALAILDPKIGHVTTISIVSTNDAQEVVPYETSWHGESVYLTFSRLSDSGATSYVARVTPETAAVEIFLIGPTAMRGYASGAALTPDCRAAIYSPPNLEGGLIQKNLRTGDSETIIANGNYSMPFAIASGGRTILTVSKNQVVENSKTFKADLEFISI